MNNAERNLTLAKLINPMLDGTLVPDYCNSWNDLMPLVVKYRISLFDAGLDTWQAYWNDFTKETQDNPQIALVDCLIRVLEGEDE